MKRLAVVLAAGKGKRMKSKLYKVLHPVCGKPMVAHVLDAVKQINCERSVVIVGHGAETVKAYLGERAEYALQSEQLGTGHAVSQAEPLIGSEKGITIVICGDTPLVTPETLENLIAHHEAEGAAVSILTASMPDPTGYGRIIRGEDGGVLKIVEQKDGNAEELAVQEINTGTYCFDNELLFAALKNVDNNNAQGEFYLTDCVPILREQGKRIAAYETKDLSESIGVNDRVALSDAEQFMRERLAKKHMLNGVTIIDKASTYIGADVEIGSDTILYPGTILKGNTMIGEDCTIGPNTEIENSTVGNGTIIRQSVASEVKVGDRVNVGPFAYLRPGTELADEVKVGDFVELKNAKIGHGSKVPHLSYVGDAEVGSGVNIGCGAITANYDGYNKFKTIIEDDVFIGSNSNLIAPVRVGKGAYVVAGSTITSDVGESDLAIARARQENKAGYADKIRAKAKAIKEQNK
ncbi:bifunctional UDP-N-acetylglucosamine diphosphorylase/glucosamine-1-phosphate N-acetyltransferase GlmU [Paenibacillus sp. WLX2291]|uniref:bifunctional UDP-N-acetylglucosamine diphosphorylase/glucosamine-1-phosphate N-acetyltransferase GlmU n=1 Tax=Paenibacillus sp. WLX2291 TaxID=3296934 RepID=UPI00398406C0